MSRRNRTLEENERRAKISELLKVANISSMSDIQDLFKETIAEFMENGLDAELEDELGYSKYDYKNKDTENSRNGHSKKTLKTSFGNIEVETPRDRKGEFEPQLLKKNQTGIAQDVEEKFLSMYAKGMTTSDIEAEVDNKRIDGIIAGFAKPHKDVVDNCTARIRNIKRNKLYNDTENLSCFLKPLRIAEERCPCGNGNHPKHRTCSGNKVIVEFMQLFVPVLAVRADNLGKGCDRYEQPAPDKIICYPIVALLGDHIYHFADHNGIDKVVDKLLKP